MRKAKILATLGPASREPATLEAGLEIRGGAVETLSAARGVHVAIERLPDTTLPALARPPTLRAAHPVAS